MAAAASEPKKPSAGPAFYPQLSGWLGAANKAPATPGETGQPVVKVVPPSSGSDTSDTPVAVSPLNQVLLQANSRQAFDFHSGILSREAVARQALDIAAQALPHNDEPPKGKAKFKSRIRRALLNNFVLKMMLGKTLAEYVYPWIHPKARSGRSTM